MKAITLVSILFLVGSLYACSGGDGGSSNGSSPSAATTERIVYLADQDIDDVFELYLVGSSIKLNPPLSQGKNVLDFRITPDKTAVVYRADQDNNEVFELYRVEFANPGVSTKLNSPLPVGGDVWSAVITPDSSSVVYSADQTTDGVNELYRVPFATPGMSTKLNGPLVQGGNVFFEIGISPDNSAVVYRATQTSANTIELYRVPFATPGQSTKLNGVLPLGADVALFPKIAPNSTLVVYSVLRAGGLDFLSELHSVAFATAGQSTKLNVPSPGPVFGSLTLVEEYDITPDSSAVVYTLTNAIDHRFLYRVAFATPGQSTKVTPALIGSFAIRPDGAGVVYQAPKEIQNNPPAGSGPELYFVPFTTPGMGTKLSGPLVDGGQVQSFTIAPDSSAVVYAADQTSNDVVELYRVPFATPGVSTKLNGPIVAGGEVDPGFPTFPNNSLAVITPDSSALLYRASQTTAGVFELYRVPFATPGVSSTLNGPLTSGGDVTHFIVK